MIAVRIWQELARKLLIVLGKNCQKHLRFSMTSVRIADCENDQQWCSKSLKKLM